MGHTPTPWGRRNAGTPIGPSARHEIVAGKKVIARTAGLSEEDYANAKFIVRAVNSYDDLVKALSDCLKDAAGYARTHGAGEAAGRRIQARCDAAQAVLANATKGAP